MRKFPRSVRLILLAAAIAVASYQPGEASSYVCWDDGYCHVCCDLISDCCTAACLDGDRFWC